jgi:hypothetical protein
LPKLRRIFHPRRSLKAMKVERLSSETSMTLPPVRISMMVVTIWITCLTQDQVTLKKKEAQRAITALTQTKTRTCIISREDASEAERSNPGRKLMMRPERKKCWMRCKLPKRSTTLDSLLTTSKNI